MYLASLRHFKCTTPLLFSSRPLRTVQAYVLFSAVQSQYSMIMVYTTESTCAGFTIWSRCVSLSLDILAKVNWKILWK